MCQPRTRTARPHYMSSLSRIGFHILTSPLAQKSLACLSSVARMYQPRTRTVSLHYIWRCGAGVSAQNKDGQTPLHLASQAGRVEVTRMLIERGVGVSAKDKDGQTPLHLVSQAGRLEVAPMLVERGVDVSAQNKDHQAPLHLALEHGHLEVA